MNKKIVLGLFALQTIQYVENADRVVASEARDASWTDARELPGKVKAILPSGSGVDSVTCGSTLCRVETTHPTMEAYRAFLGGLTPMPKPGDTEFKSLWAGPSAFLVLNDPPNDGQEVHAVAYMARAGNQLPSPPSDLE